jgi:MFS family permease
VQEGYVND